MKRVLVRTHPFIIYNTILLTEFILLICFRLFFLMRLCFFFYDIYGFFLFLYLIIHGFIIHR